MKPIVQTGDPVLRETAEYVPVEEIQSSKIQTVLAAMKQSLAEKEHGVALAAPQIGIPLRIFVVSKKAFAEEPSQEEQFVYINPKIIRSSKDTDLMSEGCLSVEGKYGTVRRSTRATVQALNESGQLFTRGASGLLAQIFQHEVDHLNGILFTDRAEELHDVEES